MIMSDSSWAITERKELVWIRQKYKSIHNEYCNHSRCRYTTRKLIKQQVNAMMLFLNHSAFIYAQWWSRNILNRFGRVPLPLYCGPIKHVSYIIAVTASTIQTWIVDRLIREAMLQWRVNNVMVYVHISLILYLGINPNVRAYLCVFVNFGHGKIHI